MKKYFGIVLLKTENKSTNIVSYDETFLSIEASSDDEAKKIAEKYGKSCETNYKNGLGENIFIQFMKVIDINTHLREEYEEGVKELYSRHFEDIETYSKFEKLYKE